MVIYNTYCKHCRVEYLLYVFTFLGTKNVCGKHCLNAPSPHYFPRPACLTRVSAPPARHQPGRSILHQQRLLARQLHLVRLLFWRDWLCRVRGSRQRSHFRRFVHRAEFHRVGVAGGGHDHRRTGQDERRAGRAVSGAACARAKKESWVFVCFSL
jgi:hypothetical protein